MPESGKPNLLIHEKSPYLQEHAYNPVEWRPWGDESFRKAKNDGKPIFLSIGYSTCHWCHVMRAESFEDEETAALINRYFIPIKVDREERPEVDAYYMNAVQALTGGGGWPLSVFLTPDLKPFYGGTYFPPEPRYGMPSFRQVLEFVAKVWKERRSEALASSEQVATSIAGEARAGGRGALSKDLFEGGYASLAASFDQERGGFGGAPKFPLPNSIGFMLRYNFRTGNATALKVATKTLDAMMGGGIRDHLGGGFHRYSTDRVWLVPHFEKMLYDNSLLAKVYLEAFLITRKKEYAEVASGTLEWMLREMRGRGGGFFSAQDADTTDGEGVFYTWTPDEVEAVLGKEAVSFSRLYGVTKTGNFEGGRSILHHEGPPSETEEGRNDVTVWKAKLLKARAQRPKPLTDTKILTSWNGLAISALSLGGTALPNSRYIEAATKAARYVLKVNSKDGKLLRRSVEGEAAFDGTLEDYAFFVQGLLDLFEASQEAFWLSEAKRLAGVMVEALYDGEDGGFFMSGPDSPGRIKQDYDGPTPSGNSVAAGVLIRLSEITGDPKSREMGEKTLQYFKTEMEDQPSGHAFMLSALDLLLNGMKEVVITAPTEESAAEMSRVANRSFLPNKAVILATPKSYSQLSSLSPLLEGRRPGKSPVAFVCENFACKLPARTSEQLASQLATTTE